MMKRSNDSLLSEVTTYYSDKLTKYGPTPQGVDWNGEKSQNLRFLQLCKIIDTLNQFSINDFGCGYAALYDFLDYKYQNFSYTGIDISESMIHAATQHLQNKQHVNFLRSSEPNQIADYSIASGIFNVRLGCKYDEWTTYLESTLDILNQISRLGFAFNCLTSYSDTDKMQNNLYYADPCVLFDLCKKRYSRNISLLHDYDLYEFTILVRKKL